MFKILIIAYYFPPMGLSGVQRTLKFAKYLSKNKWKTTVITSGTTAYYAHDMSLLKEAVDSDIEIIRTKSLDPNSIMKGLGTVSMPKESLRKIMSKISKTVFIPDNKINWANQAYLKAKELLTKESYDVLYVSIPPFSAFSSVAKLKKEFGIPLVVDYRDLWYGNHFAYYPTPYHKLKNKQLEDAALRCADKIIAVNRKIKEKLLTTYKFLTFEDVTIIPHGYDAEDFSKAVVIPRMNEKIKITYSGIFYENITPKYMLKALKKLSVERPDIASTFEFNFIGHFRKENHKLVQKLKLQEYIKEFGYLDHEDAVSHLVSSDILWVMLGNGSNMDTVTPGKMLEYIGAGKPILATVPEGATKSICEEYGASYIVPPDDIEKLKNTLINIYEDFKKKILPVPKEEIVKRYDREYLTELLIKELQFLIKD